MRVDDDLPEGLQVVLESAARLQTLVPDAVLVGGTAAAYYARHRMSSDHDHVLIDLRDRFDAVLDALERDGDFVLNRATPGKIILGELGGIEAGVRQLIRKRPLEVQRVTLMTGAKITVPTLDETARIKAYLIVKRNQMRDYLDVAALSGRFGAREMGAALSVIDDYYSDDSHPNDHPVQSQLARQLASPEPKDRSRIAGLASYKHLDRRWHDWDAVVAECRRLAAHVV
ncbi:nucleotidyl transferase AbiEii/AbiGii toxin family protein [Paramicrobacterium fandaimingii]|uniref:nucleotidyl transferase AbiEii/AbiGii toxin family protein n=1 Tax=Paramicrobacterium fandaimingii TaxID=2708079 RepID=UPI0014210B63|nr:nucleotidyl transferase AbiEii/AbiGii toxin family protein [Microbacterium fandaimingii]